MAELLSIIDKTEGLAEGLADFYTEKEGKFHLNVKGVDGNELQNITGLRTTIETLRGEVKTGQKDLKAFGDLDPKAAFAALERIKTFDESDPKKETAQKLESLKDELTGLHTTALDAKDATIASLTKHLRGHVITNAIHKAALDKDVDADPDGLNYLMQDHVEMSELKDGEIPVAVILNNTGGPRVNSMGKDMTITDLAIELKGVDKNARFFNGTQQSGGGAANEAGGGDGSSSYTITKEQARDHTAYKVAKEAAEKAGAKLTITE